MQKFCTLITFNIVHLHSALHLSRHSTFFSHLSDHRQIDFSVFHQSQSSRFLALQKLVINMFPLMTFGLVFLNSDFILQIIKQRIWRHTYQEGLVWNSEPGALMTLREFSDTLTHFPFHNNNRQISHQTSQAGCEKFTAVIYTTLTSASSSTTSKIAASGVHLSAPIFKLARNVAASNFAQQVK